MGLNKIIISAESISLLIFYSFDGRLIDYISEDVIYQFRIASFFSILKVYCGVFDL